MANARNQLLPVNFQESNQERGVLRDRQRATNVGMSGADVEPMHIDRYAAAHTSSLKSCLLF